MADERLISDLYHIEKEDNSRVHIAFRDCLTINTFSQLTGGSIKSTPFGRKSQINISISKIVGNNRTFLEFGIHVNRMRMILEKIKDENFNIFREFNEDEGIRGLISKRCAVKKQNVELKENESLVSKCIFSVDDKERKIIITLKEGIGNIVRDDLNRLDTTNFRELKSVQVRLTVTEISQLASDVLAHIELCQILNAPTMLQNRQIFSQQCKSGVFKDCNRDLEKMRKVEENLSSPHSLFSLESLVSSQKNNSSSIDLESIIKQAVDNALIDFKK